MHGGGTFRTVQEAIDSAPNMSDTRYTIYVKQGVYTGQAIVGKEKQNLFLIGDGMDPTVVTGSLNIHEGKETFDSGTLVVEGDGFIAQDMGFFNTAGPEKEQAVAVRVSGDRVVMNRCKMDAYQDTLYVHHHRQFYTNCVITGTIDFIFGNARVVIQSSQIIPRKPRPGQENMITAQSASNDKRSTGIVIQNCTILPSLDLAAANGSVKTYLGRPWGNFSRTVIMESFIGEFIDAKGWHPWKEGWPLDKLYYGEFENCGPGANTSGRVQWDGYHVISDPLEALNFTVAQLIDGDEWLPFVGVDYTSGLMNRTKYSVCNMTQL
ncbi:pectinesterase/pectinesterase inhibitor 18-like [Papaver somniferum]|uniref:pectinesterase/pectinesterase inhibitor 18-like n=1 Tax=Papaver somniferum TaxID=3469 RepID=UPI000E6F8EF9|nr:pectinesterase/pectinesterase inhibitor 18-like [Papaver somniferum]